MVKRKLFGISLLSLSFQASFAQTEAIDNEIEKNIASTTAVITFLTSQESVSGGIYYVGPPNKPDSEFSTLKLPYRHAYPIHEDGSRLFMLLGYGRFDMKQEYQLTTGNATSRWEANSFSIGTGYSNRVDKTIRWFANIEAAYTQIYHHYNIPSSEAVRTTESRSLGDLEFDWHTDTLSLIPSVGLRVPLSPYSKKLEGWSYEPKIVYLYTHSIFEENNLEEVSASSGLLVNRLNFGEPWHFDFETWGVAINPQFNRTDAFGSVGDGLKTNFWYEANLNFRLKSFDKAWWNGLEYGFSILQGEHFNGGQLSIGFSLDRFFGS